MEEKAGEEIEWFETASNHRHGQVYYFNVKTRESLWERPEGVRIKPLEEAKKLLCDMAQNKNDGSKSEKKSKGSSVTGDSPSKKIEGGMISSEKPTTSIHIPTMASPNYRKSPLSSTPDLSFSSPSSGDSSNLKRRWSSDKAPDENKNDKTIHLSLKNKRKSEDIASLSSENSGGSSKLDKSWKPIHWKTPIQDKYEQKKQQLLENQKKKDMTENKNIEVKKKPIHERLGYLNQADSTSKGSIKKLKNEEPPPAEEVCKIKRSSIVGSIKKLKNEEPPPAEEVCKIERSPIFDLRNKLNSRKDPSHAASEEFEMDWETSKCDIEEESQLQTIAPRAEEISTEASQIPENLKRIYMVTDTSFLCEYPNVIEDILKAGKVQRLEAEIVIVVPFIALQELDRIKNKEGVGEKARQVNRVIHATSSKSSTSKYLRLQSGAESKEKPCFDVECNDDLVLHCCLQQREKCNKDEVAFLMTEDNNLANKAISFKLFTYKWISFRQWVRDRNSRNQANQTNATSDIMTNKNSDEMEVDVAKQARSIPTDRRFMALAQTQTQPDKHCQPLNYTLQNFAKSCAEDIKLEFNTYLEEVFEEASYKEFGIYKDYSAKPSGSVLDCIINLQKKWFSITETSVNNESHSLLRHLIELFKKTNMNRSDPVHLTAGDINNMFRLGRSLGEILNVKYKEKTENFLKKLAMCESDWNFELNKLDSSPSARVDSEDLIFDSVDLAVQNIFSRLRSEYATLKEKNAEREEWMKLFTESGNFGNCLFNILHDSSTYNRFIKLLEKNGCPEITSDNVKDYLNEEPERARKTVERAMKFSQLVNIAHPEQFFLES